MLRIFGGEIEVSSINVKKESIDTCFSTGVGEGQIVSGADVARVRFVGVIDL